MTPEASMGVLIAVIWLVWLVCSMSRDAAEEKQQGRERSHANTDSGSGRSAWEQSIVSYIRCKYPETTIRTNDRTIIPSRTSGGYLEIDIWMPGLRLGIEANGEAFHDHSQYLSDQSNGTVISEEMYKEKYCHGRGFELLHVWDSETETTIHDKIDSAIRRARSRP